MRKRHFTVPVRGSIASTAPWPPASVQLLMGPRRRLGMVGAFGIGLVGASACGTNNERLPPPKFKPCLYSTGTPPKISPSSSQAETYISRVRGLQEGEY